MTANTDIKSALQKARMICPKCGKKGVGYANHAHAYGYKDYDRATCRYCHAGFAIKPKDKEPKGEQ